MSVDRIVMAVIGVVILVTLGLSQWHAAWWLWITALFGLHLVQMAFTGFCPLAMILKSMGVRPGSAFGSESASQV